MFGLDRNFQVQRYESPGVRGAHGGQGGSLGGQIGSHGEHGVHGGQYLTPFLLVRLPSLYLGMICVSGFAKKRTGLQSP